jgi:hypothetical protein
MIARLRWDNHKTLWSRQCPRPYKRGSKVEMIIPPPVHWKFNERMIHELQGGIAVQATLIVVEIEG